MSQTMVHGLRQVVTADPAKSIWSKVPQEEFREHVVALEKQTNAVPIDCLTATSTHIDEAAVSKTCLPVHIEKQVVDDFAYIAAVSEGAQSVAAGCMEQRTTFGRKDEDAPTLIVRVAGMDIVNEAVQSMLHQIAKVLEISSQSLEAYNTGDSGAENAIFALIIQQHTQKLLGRLRSKKWTKPTYLDRTHKKPLWQDFTNLIHRVQHVYPKRAQRKTREATTSQLSELAERCQEFEASAVENEPALQALVKSTYTACRNPKLAAYAKDLENAGSTPQIAAALKTLRQLEKIGAYWRIARDLVSTARKFPETFRKIHIDSIPPYASVPTAITYEPWAGKCHVHAEVQLVVEYALAQDRPASDTWLKPRTVGTSKYLCYLCYLFLTFHGGFESLSTHGRLYDQWTVPDLAEYDELTREKFASVLEAMDEHVQGRIEETKGFVWRPEPMTSRQNLLYCERRGGDDVEELKDHMSRLDIIR